MTWRRNKEKLCMSLLNPSCISTNAMRHGRSFESVAIDKFSEQFRIIVEPSGLCIDIEKTYLAASPDGFIRKDSIVEVKCPYSGRYMHIHPKCKPFRFLELRDRNIALKKHQTIITKFKDNCTSRNGSSVIS